jgi:hypothetical protein
VASNGGKFSLKPFTDTKFSYKKIKIGIMQMFALHFNIVQCPTKKSDVETPVDSVLGTSPEELRDYGRNPEDLRSGNRPWSH